MATFTAYALRNDMRAEKAFGIDCQGGKGMAGFGVDVCPTCAAISHGTPHAVCIIVDPLASNSMKSKNPHSGFHKTEYAVTLDTSSQNPTRNGGGMMIVEVRQ